MRASYSWITVIAISILLNGCYHTRGSTRTPSIPHRHYSTKNPKSIALFHNENNVLTPYRIIGIARVSKYNFIGKMRKEEAMHNMMKQLAASMGGDALIHINKSNDVIQAHVIAYQKILI